MTWKQSSGRDFNWNPSSTDPCVGPGSYSIPGTGFPQKIKKHLLVHSQKEIVIRLLILLHQDQENIISLMKKNQKHNLQFSDHGRNATKNQIQYHHLLLIILPFQVGLKSVPLYLHHIIPHGNADLQLLLHNFATF